MDMRETAAIMDILKASYPAFYRKPEDMEKGLPLWYEMFKNDDFRLVLAAVKSAIEADDSGYPPSIGQVKAKIRLITDDGEVTEQEAWNLIAKACRNGLYGSKEEFEKLPPVLQRLVGNHEQIRTWAMMDSDTLHSVVSSNFQRSYKVVVNRQKELDKLPDDVKMLVSHVSKNLSLESKEKVALPESEEAPRATVSRERIREIMKNAGVTVPLTDEEREQKRREMIEKLRGGA